MTDRVVIVGGGPGGYEAAHVAAQLGAEVTIVDTDGLGGSAVLTDCVPSKTLIATADFRSRFDVAGRMGVEFSEDDGDPATHEPLAHGVEAHIDLAAANRRVMDLARAQSADIRAALTEALMPRWFTRAFRDGPEARMIRNMVARQPAEGYAGACAAISGTDFYTPTSGLRLPCLGIAGSDDGSTPPDLVKSTADLAHALGLEMTAEGVEDEPALALLKMFGCDWAQGYLLSRALPLDALRHFLATQADAQQQPAPGQDTDRSRSAR